MGNDAVYGGGRYGTAYGGANADEDDTMTETFTKYGEKLDQDLEELRKRSGGGDGAIDEKWYQTEHYGPATPDGDYHNSPVGLVLDPDEPLQVHEATIDAESEGKLFVRIYPQRAEGGQGYNDSPVAEYQFDVEPGVQTVEFEGLELLPLPGEYSGYTFSINESPVKLRRDTSVSIPLDIEIGTIRGASVASGSTFDNYFHFFNLKISSDRTDRPIHTNDGGVHAEFDSVNETHQLNSSVNDWGAGIQRLVNKARPGDTIEFGAGAYVTSTPVTVDKPLAILGRGANSDLRDPTGPMIYPSDDFTVMETTDGVGITTGGYHLVGQGAQTGQGIVTHGRSMISNITGDRWDDHLVHLSQDSEHDNLNSSRVWNVAGRGIDGAVVAATRTTRKARELQALKIDVRMSFANDYGIFAGSGFGNQYYIQQAEGTHESALHMDSQRSFGVVQYAEGGTKPVVHFADGTNGALVIHAGGSTPSDEVFTGHRRNYRLCIGRQNDPLIDNPVEGTKLSGGLEVTDGPVDVEIDGKVRRLTVDSDGNPAFKTP